MEKELSLLLQLESITGNGSQKIKQDLIAANRNEKLDFILQTCYNPFITTKLNKVDYAASKTTEINPDTYQVFKDLIQELSNAPSANQTHRNRAYDLITNSGLDSARQKMLGRILTKNMNISLGAKLINKAVGSELIPDPSLMLAKDDIERIEKWKGIICELKYDGVRVIGKVTSTNSVEFFTRSFNQLPSRFMKKIEQEILQLAAGRSNIFFDGELTDFARTTVSGKVTSILAGTPPETIGDSFLFNIFDIEHSDVLNIGKGSTKYPERRKNLEASFAGKTFQNLILGSKWEVKNKEEIWAIYKHIVEVEKGEGVILKDPEHVYTCRRDASWIKMKEIKDCDLRIIGANEPHGMSVREEKGWIGGFICQTEDKKLTVSVGSGFSEAFLEEIKTNGIDSYIGKIAKVKYNMLVEDKNGTTSLFLPTLLEVRPDKNVADTFEKLKTQKGKA